MNIKRLITRHPADEAWPDPPGRADRTRSLLSRERRSLSKGLVLVSSVVVPWWSQAMPAFIHLRRMCQALLLMHPIKGAPPGGGAQGKFRKGAERELQALNAK